VKSPARGGGDMSPPPQALATAGDEEVALPVGTAETLTSTDDPEG